MAPLMALFCRRCIAFSALASQNEWHHQPASDAFCRFCLLSPCTSGRGERLEIGETETGLDIIAIIQQSSLFATEKQVYLAAMFDYFANPSRFMRIANRFVTACYLAYNGQSIISWSICSPADYQQGDTVRIIYIHVPSAWLAYLAMLGWAMRPFLLFGVHLPILPRGQLPPLARFLPF